jgi:hypothetical protein
MLCQCVRKQQLKLFFVQQRRHEFILHRQKKRCSEPPFINIRNNKRHHEQTCSYMRKAPEKMYRTTDSYRREWYSTVPTSNIIDHVIPTAESILKQSNEKYDISEVTMRNSRALLHTIIPTTNIVSEYSTAEQCMSPQRGTKGERGLPKALIDSTNQSYLTENNGTCLMANNHAKALPQRKHELPLQQKRRELGKKSIKGRRAAVKMIQRGRDICNEALYPIGSFAQRNDTYRLFNAVYHAVVTEAQLLVHENYQNMHKQGNKPDHAERMVNITPELISNAINLAFQLLIRICREPTMAQGKIYEYHAPKFTNMLFQTWKVAAMQNEVKTLSACDVAQLLQQISHNKTNNRRHEHQPRHDTATIRLILDVATHEARNNSLSLPLAQQASEASTRNILEDSITKAALPQHPIPPAVLKNAPVESPPSGEVNLAESSTTLLRHLYSALIRAHAKSDVSSVDDTVRKMYGIIDEMKMIHQIQPDVTTYNILLRFLRQSKRTTQENFELAFQMMKSNNVPPEITTYIEVVQFYTSGKFDTSQSFDIAEQYIQEMVNLIVKAGPINDDDQTISAQRRQKYYSDMTFVTQAAQCLMDAYGRESVAASPIEKRLEIISRAQTLFLLLDRHNIFSGTSNRK